MRTLEDRCTVMDSGRRSSRGANWRCDVTPVTCDVQADDLLVMREQNYQLGKDNSRLRRRLAELQKVRVVTVVVLGSSRCSASTFARKSCSVHGAPKCNPQISIII